jgi:hypothetical protein
MANSKSTTKPPICLTKLYISKEQGGTAVAGEAGRSGP